MSLQYSVLGFEPMTFGHPITTGPGFHPLVAVIGSPTHMDPPLSEQEVSIIEVCKV